MKSKSTFIYSFIISLIFASAVFFFCYSLIQEYTNGSERTGYKFDHMLHITSTTLSSYDPLSPEFNKVFNEACGNMEDYSFITLKNASSLLYVYPDATVTNEGNSSHFCRVYSSHFTKNGISYTLTASLYLLRPSLIFYYARFSFLIIFAATVLLFILILYLHLSEKNSDNNTIYNETDEFLEQKSKFSQETDNRSESEPFFSEKKSPDECEPSEEKYVSEDTKNESDFKNEEILEAAVPADTAVKQENPEGLFSPITGLGWEQYLEVRLDSELVRAASAEQDLSLFIIRIPTMALTDDVTQKVCNYLLEQFQFKDMLFEYKTDGFAGIQENTAVDEAVSFAGTLYLGIAKVLKENSTNLKCAIGISSRSVRMLPGKRLIQEAAEALEHAFKEPDSPIIAFRANADKYRKFIETENKN
ncbi:MAG: hypothetical protein M0P01_01225 [Treponema sp.]|nr:hypothetical protein [Treponema sp.]